MNKQTIYAVSPARSVYLLTDKTFRCTGSPAVLLTTRELKNKQVLKSRLQTVDDQLSRHETLGLNISRIVDILDEHGSEEFDLASYTDAELIFYCIDHFLNCQHHLKYGNASEEELSDYYKLGKLADLMLEKIDYIKRATLPNVIAAPTPKDVKAPTISQQQMMYNNIFKAKIKLRGQSLAPLPDELNEVKTNETPTYDNPFKRKLAQSGINTLNRFSK